MMRPENGPLDFTILIGDSETVEAEEAGEKGSSENDWLSLNDDEKSINSLEHPLPAITSTLPPPPIPPPIFSIIKSANTIGNNTQNYNYRGNGRCFG